MKEELINELTKANNNRYVFLFNITDKNGNFIGNYSLRKEKNKEIRLVRNDIYDNGDKENKNATYKLTKNDKFTLETIDYMTAEMLDAKDLIDFYDLLKTNDELLLRDLDDLNIKSYIALSQKHKGYNYNHFRENIYNSKDIALIAEEQLNRNIKGISGGQMSETNSRINTRKSQMTDFVLNNLEDNDLFFNVASGKKTNLEDNTAYDNLITIRYNKYIMENLLNFDNVFSTPEKFMDKQLSDYKNFRDTYQIMIRYQKLYDKQKAQAAARSGLTYEEKPKQRAIPVVEETFKPKVKQLTLYDLIEPEKYKRK